MQEFVGLAHDDGGVAWREDGAVIGHRFPVRAAITDGQAMSVRGDPADGHGLTDIEISQRLAGHPAAPGQHHRDGQQRTQEQEYENQPVAA